METVGMKVFPRTPGKKPLKESRAKGLLPVNIYGKGLTENITGSVDRAKMIKALQSPRGRNIIMALETEGKTLTAIPYRIDIHPVKNNVAHIDFMVIDDQKPISIKIPLVREGRSQGEVVGGRALQVLKEVAVRCLPADMPLCLKIDITPYNIGDRIMVNDLPYPDGVTPLYRENIPAIVFNKGRGQTTDDATVDGAAKPAEGEAKPGDPKAVAAKPGDPKAAEKKPAEKKK